MPAAEARTAKELNICWVNQAPGEVLDLEVVVDGPSYKTASLDNGDCIAWDVRPGQYKITVEDVDELRDAMKASCPDEGEAALAQVHDQAATGALQDELPGAPQQRGLVTNVRKDRRTTVTAILNCVSASA